MEEHVYFGGIFERDKYVLKLIRSSSRLINWKIYQSKKLDPLLPLSNYSIYLFLQKHTHSFWFSVLNWMGLILFPIMIHGPIFGVHPSSPVPKLINSSRVMLLSHHHLDGFGKIAASITRSFFITPKR